MTKRNELKELKRGSESPLFKKVCNILLSHNTNDEDLKSYISDLMQHGCVSGMVSELIYYSDTIAFYKKYKKEIKQMLTESVQETGLQPAELFKTWEEEDPLALDTNNQNLLAWFSFEETVRNISNQLEIE